MKERRGSGRGSKRHSSGGTHSLMHAQIPVRPVPGACAVAAGISISGMGAGEFLFKGFLPAKGQER